MNLRRFNERPRNASDPTVALSEPLEVRHCCSHVHGDDPLSRRAGSLQKHAFSLANPKAPNLRTDKIWNLNIKHGPCAAPEKYGTILDAAGGSMATDINVKGYEVESRANVHLGGFPLFLGNNCWWDMGVEARLKR